jgi:hypothetical protein
MDFCQEVGTEKHDRWVGRKKITGLLKGTLSDEEDKILRQRLNSPNNLIREKAKRAHENTRRPI